MSVDIGRRTLTGTLDYDAGTWQRTGKVGNLTGNYPCLSACRKTQKEEESRQQDEFTSVLFHVLSVL